MTVFWIVAGLFVAGALLFVLPPLFQRSDGKPKAEVSRDAATVSIYQDQLAELDADLEAGTLSAEQYRQGREELERRLLEDVSDSPAAAAPSPTEPWIASGRRSAIVVLIALPVLSGLLYWKLGSREGLSPLAAQTAQNAKHALTPEQIEGMVAKLSARLQENPNDAEGWQVLARTYNALRRFPDASEAYARAVKLSPNDAQLWADYADTLAMAKGKRLAGEPTDLIQQALRIDPKNMKALALAGTAAFERKDFNGAVSYWERLLQTVPAESDVARSVKASIQEAQVLAAGGNPAERRAAVAAARGTPAGAGSGSAGTADAKLTGTVSLSPELAGKVAPTDTVFIFARAVDGPKMPLAIVRKEARELPITFALDDSMAMMPQMRLSNFPAVVVGARISKSGNATPQSGDLMGSSPPVKPGTANVAIVINQTNP